MTDDDEILRLMDEYVENLAGLARVMQQVDRELGSDARTDSDLAALLAQGGLRDKSR